MIAPALRHLLWLRLRGGSKARLRELLTPRGLTLLLLTCALIWLLSGAPSVQELGQVSLRVGDPVQLRQQLTEYLPVGLLLFSFVTALTANGSPVHFSAAETNFLFTAPLNRRSLLLYKLSVFAFGATISALLVSLIFSVGSPVATFLGALLILLFTQLFSAAVGMSIQLVKASRFARLHRVAVVALPVTGLSGIALSQLYSSLSWPAFFEQIRDSVVAKAVLAPFIPFTKVFVADTLASGELYGWAFLGFVLIGVLALVVMRLDELTYESAMVAEESPQRSTRAALSFGLIGRSSANSVTSRSVSGRFGGVATLAWRQWVIASRSASRTLVFYIVFMAASGVAITNLEFISPHVQVTILVVISVFMLPRSMVFDFRSDLQLIERLRQLPIAPWRICLGQILVPVLLTTLLEWVLLSTALPSLSPLGRGIALLFGLFLLPLNLLIFSIENLMILAFPVPLTPVGRLDFQFIGRNLVDMALKVVLTLFVATLGASLGLATFATTKSFPLTVLVAWLVTVVISLCLLPLMALALRRFDVGYRALE